MVYRQKSIDGAFALAFALAVALAHVATLICPFISRKISIDLLVFFFKVRDV